MEVNKRYENLQDLMNRIHAAEVTSKAKQDEIDKKKKALREETRIIVVEEGKAEIAKLEAEKAEFDEMTQNAVANAKTEIVEVQQETENEYNAKLFEFMEKKKVIQTKLESMRAKGLAPDKMEMMEKAAENALVKLNSEMAIFQKNHFERREFLDMYSKYAVDLDPNMWIIPEKEKSDDKKPDDKKTDDKKPDDEKTDDKKPDDKKPDDKKPDDEKPDDKKPDDEKPDDKKPDDKKPDDKKPDDKKPDDKKPDDEKPDDKKPDDKKPDDEKPDDKKPDDKKPDDKKPDDKKPDDKKSDDKNPNPAKLGVQVGGFWAAIIKFIRFLRRHSKEGSSVEKWCDSMEARVTSRIKALPAGRVDIEPPKVKTKNEKEDEKLVPTSEEKEKLSEEFDRSWLVDKLKNPGKDKVFTSIAANSFNVVKEENSKREERWNKDEFLEQVVKRTQADILMKAKEQGISWKSSDGTRRSMQDIYADLSEKLRLQEATNDISRKATKESSKDNEEKQPKQIPEGEKPTSGKDR